MAADILLSLIAANLAAAVGIVLMIAARRPLRRAFGARLTYAAWLIVPLGAAASLLPARPIAVAPIAPAPIRPLAEQVIVWTEGAATMAPFDWAALALGVWLAAALVGLAMVFRRQFLTLRLLGPLAREADGCWRAKRTTIGPAVIGVLNGRIVLPADFEQRFDAGERNVILAHERSHLAGHDVRINAAIAALRCLNWFNPLVHAAAHLIRQDQELACDEAVMARFPHERRTYAQALLKSQIACAPLPLGCYWPVRSPQRLKERILMLTLKAPSRGRRLAGGTLVALLGLGTGYATWAAAPAALPLPALRLAVPTVSLPQTLPDAAPAIVGAEARVQEKAATDPRHIVVAQAPAVADTRPASPSNRETCEALGGFAGFDNSQTPACYYRRADVDTYRLTNIETAAAAQTAPARPTIIGCEPGGEGGTLRCTVGPSVQQGEYQRIAPPIAATNARDIPADAVKVKCRLVESRLAGCAATGGDEAARTEALKRFEMGTAAATNVAVRDYVLRYADSDTVYPLTIRTETGRLIILEAPIQ